jgi:hypothetical protein
VVHPAAHPAGEPEVFPVVERACKSLRTRVSATSSTSTSKSGSAALVAEPRWGFDTDGDLDGVLGA